MLIYQNELKVFKKNLLIDTDINEKFMTIFYKLLVKTLFTLTIFVLLVQAESAQYRPTEFCYYANAAKTELVVAAGQGVRLSA